LLAYPAFCIVPPILLAEWRLRTVTLINTNGMAFIGPGSEWFWAALQFTALAITFVAVYRQLLIARSQRGVEQVDLYTRQFDHERMVRHRVAILIALRDGVEIPRAAGVVVGSYFETLGALTRKKHLDINLLWDLFTIHTLTWWAALVPFVHLERARDGDTVMEEWEWLVGAFKTMNRRAGRTMAIDAAYVAAWVAGSAIQTLEDIIRVEQALRSVIVASPDVPDTAQSLAATPAPASSAGNDAIPPSGSTTPSDPTGGDSDR
jgi:hypothetical protein